MSFAKPTVVDVFSGMGGISIGFRRRGFRIAGAIEIDETAAEGFRLNLGVDPIVDDVRNVTGKALLRKIGMKRGELGVLVGCAPCQSFSRMRYGTEEQPEDIVRHSLPELWAKLVVEVLPRHIVFENVPGLLKAEDGALFQRMRRRLTRAGYNLVWSVENAADFGVPQRRTRLLLIGSRIAQPKLPDRTHRDPADTESRKLRPWTTVSQAIADLTPLGAGRTDRRDPYHSARKLEPITIKRLKLIKPGQGKNDLPYNLLLPCHKGHNGHSDVYGRMRWDEPAPTMTGGCTNVSKGRFVHPSQHRGITIREALRIQTFPDDVHVLGTRDQMQIQVGNAVPVLLAERIAAEIMRLERLARRRRAA